MSSAEQPNRRDFIKDRMKYLYTSRKTADVQFVVPQRDGTAHSEQYITAHRNILASASDAFETMFYGSFDTPQTIVLEGCTAEAWQCIMKYIYLDEITIEMEDSYYVLFFSKQYMLHRLFEQTVQFVKSKMTVQNVCSILPSLIVFDELKESLLEFADKNADAVLRSDGFCGLPHEVMLATISRDSLVIREIVLYDSVVKWAKAALERESKEVIPENIRSCLGDALYSIRFPLMTLEEFSKGPAVSGMLTSEECVAIFLWFGSKTVPEKFHVAVRKGENGSGNRRCRYCNTWMHSVHGYSTCNHCGRSF